MELRATDFSSCLMPAVATDSAIGSIIHLPLKSANLLATRLKLASDDSQPECGTFLYPSTYSALGRDLLLEEHHYMSRSTFLVLALSCALSCAPYGHNPSSTQPPAAPAASPATTQSSPPPSAAGTPATPAADATRVPMNEAVITPKNVCQPKAGATTPPPGCVSGMTREQFEKMITALQQPDKPPMPFEVRRNFASQYAKMLVFADAARELNLENDPRYVLIFQFVRNQILTDALNQHIVQEYSHLPDQQIEDYYKHNPKKYV